jgi:hypothetical protein
MKEAKIENVTNYLNPAHYAVADAMMVAHANLLSKEIDNPPNFTGVVFEGIIERKTNGKCRDACISVIKHLANNHSTLFKGMVILEALGGIKDLINKRWNHHDNFLVLDKKGFWYAGSPANFRPQYTDDEDQRFTRLIISRKLQEVLDRIEYEDEGLWPTAKFIKNAFKNQSTLPLSPTSVQLAILRLKNLGNEEQVDSVFNFACRKMDAH